MLEKLSNANWQLILDKFGTVAVDRRFWATWVFPVVFSLKIFPYLNENDVVELSDTAVAWAALIVPLMSTVLLSFNWTKRAPSGLQYKDSGSVSPELAEFIKRAVAEKK